LRVLREEEWMPDQKFTDAELVKAWMESVNQVDVARRLGVTQPPVSKRAARLRKAGVLLPKFPALSRGPQLKPVDVAGLNALIAGRPSASEVQAKPQMQQQATLTAEERLRLMGGVFLGGTANGEAGR
jgi:hypothetical protein